MNFFLSFVFFKIFLASVNSSVPILPSLSKQKDRESDEKLDQYPLIDDVNAVAAEVIETSKLIIHKVRYSDDSVYALKRIRWSKGSQSDKDRTVNDHELKKCEAELHWEQTIFKFFSGSSCMQYIMPCKGIHKEFYISTFFEDGSAATWKAMGKDEIKTLISHILQVLAVFHESRYVHKDVRPGTVYRQKQEDGSYKYILGGLGKTFVLHQKSGRSQCALDFNEDFASPGMLRLKEAEGSGQDADSKKKYYTEAFWDIPEEQLSREQVLEIRHTLNYFGPAADFFSFGLTIAALRVGYNSVKGDWAAFRARMMAKDYPEEFEKEFQELLNVLLHPIASQRTIENIIASDYFDDPVLHDIKPFLPILTLPNILETPGPGHHVNDEDQILLPTTQLTIAGDPGRCFCVCSCNVM